MGVREVIWLKFSGVHLCAVSANDTTFSQYGKPGKTEEKVTVWQDLSQSSLTGIRLCGDRAGKRAYPLALGPVFQKEWLLCFEICNAGYEYSIQDEEKADEDRFLY